MENASSGSAAAVQIQRSHPPSSAVVSMVFDDPEGTGSCGVCCVSRPIGPAAHLLPGAPSPPIVPVHPLMSGGNRGGPERSGMQNDLRHGYGGHRPSRRHRLYTATIMHSEANLMIQAFHASVATSRKQVAERLRARHGALIAADADIRIGFHLANPLSVALVPVAVAEIIRRIEADSSRAINHGFAVDIEQRIEA